MGSGAFVSSVTKNGAAVLAVGRARRRGPQICALDSLAEAKTMRKANLDQIVAQVRSTEAAYDAARRQRDEAVIKMARVDGLNNREIAARVELTAERVAQILKKGR
jgi:DNA-directed RNA polymerase specialized sigma24 family protein